MHPAALAGFLLALVLVILSSNILVQTPLNAWLTWGAITYPFSFLITDLANRYYGLRFARRVVYAGFLIALALSAYYATPRIALASGTAFLVAELVDVHIFDRLRRRAWWHPPLISTLVGSALVSPKGGAKAITAVLDNVNRVGAGLHAKDRLVNGEKVTVSLAFLDSDRVEQQEKLDGTVAWVKSWEKGFLIGVVWDEVVTKEKNKWLYYYLEETIKSAS